MNRRRLAMVGFGAALWGASGRIVLAQDDDAASVTLTTPVVSDNDAVWAPGPPGATFRIFPGGFVTATDADGENTDYLDVSKAVAAFEAAVNQMKKEG